MNELFLQEYLLLMLKRIAGTTRRQINAKVARGTAKGIAPTLMRGTQKMSSWLSADQYVRYVDPCCCAYLTGNAIQKLLT